MAEGRDSAELLQNVEIAEGFHIVMRDGEFKVDDNQDGATDDSYVLNEEQDIGDTNIQELRVQCPVEESGDDVLLVVSPVDPVRTIKGKSYKIIKYLTMLLLSISLSLGIFIIVDDHVHSLASKDDYIFLQKFYKEGKNILDQSQRSTHRDTFLEDENRYNKESSDFKNDVPDKIILIPKLVAQSVISVINFYGIFAVFFEHFYSIRDLVSFMSFLHLYMLLDYSQPFTPIRLAIESLAMIALTSFAQKIKPLHSRPLFPCSCDPDRFILFLVSSLLPCSCCSCCAKENYDPSLSGQRQRLETFKMGTSAAIIISFGFSIYEFYSLYSHVSKQTTAIYVTALIMNSVVSIYGLLGIFSENFRSLNGHFSVTLTCVSIIIILAFRLSPNAAWLMLPLATSAFAIYILTCLMRLFYVVKDCKPYAACKIFLLFWQTSAILLAPAFVIVTYLHYTGDEQEKVPLLVMCALNTILFLLQCALLYGTLAEKYQLVERTTKTFISCVGVSIGAALLLKFVLFKDTTIDVVVFVVGAVVVALPIIPFLKYYIIEMKLFHNMMTEAEIWFIHRQVRKFFHAIEISHTVGNFCSSGLHAA